MGRAFNNHPRSSGSKSSSNEATVVNSEHISDTTSAKARAFNNHPRSSGSKAKNHSHEANNASSNAISSIASKASAFNNHPRSGSKYVDKTPATSNDIEEVDARAFSNH